MSTEVGRIDLGLDINKQMFNSQLQGISRDASAKTKTVFAGLGRTIGLTLGAAAVIGFVKSSIGLGSALGEVQNVTDTVFPRMGSQVDSFAQNAIAQFGLSELAAKRYMGQMGAMSSSMGMTEKASYDMASAVAGLAGDVSSFYDMSSDEAYTKLKSIWTGETESLKDLGVMMDQASLDQYAMANGFGKNTRAMTQQEKLLLRYQYVMSRLSHAQGDFAKTSDSWANQTRVLSLQFESLKATLGQGFISLFKPILTGLNLIIGKLTIAAQYFKAFTSLLFGGDESQEDIASAAAKANESLGGMADGTEGVGSAVKEAGKAIKGSLASFDQLNLIGQNAADSLGGISSGIGDVGGVDFGELVTGDLALPDLDKYKEAIKDFAKEYKFELGTISGSLVNFKDTLGGYIENIGKLKDLLFGNAGGSNWFTKWLASNISGQINTMSSMIGITSANLEILHNILAGDWNNAQGFEKLIGSATDLMLAFFESFLPPEMYANIEKVVLNFEGMWKTLRGQIIKYGDPTKLEFTDFLEFFKDEFERQLAKILPAKFWRIGWDIKQKFKEGYGPAASTFTEFLEQLKIDFDTYVKNLLPVRFFNLGKDIMTEFGKSFGPFVPYFGGIIDAGKEEAEKSMVSMLATLGKTVLDGVPTLKGNTTLLSEGAVEGLRGLVTGFNEIWKTLGIDSERGLKEVGNAIIRQVNKIIVSLNGFIRDYNSIGFSIPDVKIGDKVIKGFDFRVPQMPSMSYIPALAKGGLASAPTLAMVGDNKNARIDPEVIAPLSKLESIMGSGGQQKVVEAIMMLIDVLENKDFSVELDGEKLNRRLASYNKKESGRVGRNLVTIGGV
ncbi:MAG: hypothetical protein CVU95_00955 [Firmicutes bacterium HGW-Firmicutes-2]|jgi:hypothetical protein|nr:MAG: hypothetical protein CVU95_00955 [Firmicutes bacterium HGW-Firmicutes-2]